MLSDRFLPTDLKYNPRAGRYTRAGKFVSDAEINALAQVERNVLSGKLERLTEQMIRGDLELGEWELKVADTLKQSHIRMTILASGGRGRATKASYAIAGRQLKQEYQYLDRFAKQLANEEVSKEQAVFRSKLYAQSTIQTYQKVFWYNKKQEGFVMAWRSLSDAKHCKECPNHATNGWVSIDQVVPVGTNCSCRGNCRCRIKYRRY